MRCSKIAAYRPARPRGRGTRHSRNGTLWNIRPPEAALLRLDVGRSDHLPLLGFIGDEVAEVGGRARNHRAAQVGKPRLDLGVGERGVDFLVELVDDLGGRVLGCADANPRTRLVAGKDFSPKPERPATPPNGSPWLPPAGAAAGPDLFNRRRQVVERKLHLATE